MEPASLEEAREPALEEVEGEGGELDDSARQRGDFLAELEEEVSVWGIGRDKVSIREGRKASGERALAALKEAEAAVTGCFIV
jgi:hypothetical protein